MVSELEVPNTPKVKSMNRKRLLAPGISSSISSIPSSKQSKNRKSIASIAQQKERNILPSYQSQSICKKDAIFWKRGQRRIQSCNRITVCKLNKKSSKDN